MRKRSPGGDGRHVLAFYLNIVVNGLLTGLIYGLAALGLSLIFAVTRIVNYAHGSLMAFGLCGAAALTAKHGLDPLLAIPAVAASLFLGGFLTYRLLIGRAPPIPKHARTLAMLGLALILAGALSLLPGTAGPVGNPADALTFGALLFDRVTIRATLMAGLLTVMLALFFNFSQTGKAIRACADNPFGALVTGLNLERLRAVTFGLGAAIAGVAGCLLTRTLEVRPDLASNLLTLGLVVALVGELGSVEGALLGGIAVGIADALAGALLSPPLREVGGCALVLLVLLCRPQGLLGQSE